jgi:hypothetical protein
MTQPEAGELLGLEDEPWFCDRGDFWGTTKQLLLCAKCGKNEFKRHDEPRRWGRVFTSKVHTVCDECFDSLPDDEELHP